MAPLLVGQVGCIPGIALPGWRQFEVTLQVKGGSHDRLAALASECTMALQALSTLSFPSSAEEWTALLDSMTAGNPDLTGLRIVQCWPVMQEGDARSVTLRGLVRTTTQPLEQEAMNLVKAGLEKVLRGSHVEHTLAWGNSLPATANDARLEGQIRPALARAIGAENVVEIKAPFPYNAEDFALYQQRIPGVIYWLGVSNPARGIIGIVHTPDFDVDEECLVVGVKAMSNLLLDYLNTCESKYLA